MREELIALAERVEGLSGKEPTIRLAELTDEIIDALDWWDNPIVDGNWWPLKSLDAAMGLVPEGWSVGIGHLPGVDWLVRAHLRDHRPQSLTKEGHSHIWREGHSKQFALALTAAALRARAEGGE